ncbi:MAG: metalloregulator ArsR/SmtB family transcription factor [Candidatus Sulfotelmatobacter sp.]|jgi:DNA-binding transcriptional ArsR family regulator
MPDRQLDLNRLLHAIADPTRLRILEELKERPSGSGNETRPQGQNKKGHCLCAGDIEERIHLSQPTISHHMTILTKAGLVEADKQGQWRWYRRNQPAVRHLLKALRAKI